MCDFSESFLGSSVIGFSALTLHTRSSFVRSAFLLRIVGNLYLMMIIQSFFEVGGECIMQTFFISLSFNSWAFYFAAHLLVGRGVNFYCDCDHCLYFL